MSGKIEISRELAEREFSEFWEQHKLDLLERKIGRSDCKSIWLEARKVAAPVVERQPVYMVRAHGSCCWEEISGESLEMCQCQPEEYEIRKLYTSPPAPVAVVTREQVEIVAESIYWQWAGREGFVPWVKAGNSLKQDEARSIAWSTLDKVKELNS